VTEVFLTLTEVFPWFFLSCKANARVKLAKTEHGPHSTTLVCICVVRMFFFSLFVLFGCYLCCSMYCLCVNVYCLRVTTQLQLINKYNIYIFLRSHKFYKLYYILCNTYNISNIIFHLWFSYFFLLVYVKAVKCFYKPYSNLLTSLSDIFYG
jgi:hypothetical protein